MIVFTQYQNQAMRTAKPGDTNFNLTHAAFGVSGEAGEFADCIKKYLIYGKQLDRENATEELGDLLWFIALACSALGTTMDKVAQANIDKLRRRYPEKYSDQHALARLDKQHDQQQSQFTP